MLLLNICASGLLFTSGPPKVTKSGTKATKTSDLYIGREFGAFVSGCPDPTNCRLRIRGTRVGLSRSRQKAGCGFGAFVSGCPDADKVAVADSGRSCRDAQIQTTCWSRIRRPRVGMLRSRHSASRGFLSLLLGCPDPDKVLVADSVPSCRVAQISTD